MKISISKFKKINKFKENRSAVPKQQQKKKQRNNKERTNNCKMVKY